MRAMARWRLRSMGLLKCDFKRAGEECGGLRGKFITVVRPNLSSTSAGRTTEQSYPLYARTRFSICSTCAIGVSG